MINSVKNIAKVILRFFRKTPYYIKATLASRKLKDPILKEVTFIDKYYLYQGRIGDYKIKFQGRDLKSPWLPLLRVQLRSLFLLDEYKYKLRKEPVILDAGSNIGTTIIYYMNQYENPKIYGLEADPTLYNNYLSPNIKSFGFEKNVTLLNKTLWKEECILKFNSTGLDNGSISNSGNIEVSAVSLDGLIEKIGAIDLLKLDIEGAELEVLKASKKLGMIKNIYIEMEMNKDQNYEAEVLNILIGNGFKYYIRSTTKYKSPAEMFSSDEGITYYFHVFGFNQNEI